MTPDEALDLLESLNDQNAAMAAAVLRERLTELRAFADRLLNPEDLGFAVSFQVRDEARLLLGLERCEQAEG